MAERKSGSALRDPSCGGTAHSTALAPLRPPPTGTARWPTSELLRSDTHGVISLTLSPNGYDWDFRPFAGKKLA